MKKLTLDEKICLKNNLTLQEAVITLALKLSQDTLYGNAFANLENRKVIAFDDVTGEYYPTPHWNDVLDNILCDSMGGTDSEERLLNLAKKMRECFPEGRMPGTPYYYRCNNREIVLKLKKFFLQYGNYTDEKIIDATKRFVASFNGNYKFLPLLKYFISKVKPVADENSNVHNVEYSPLADYLENKESEDYNSSDDWLVISRN